MDTFPKKIYASRDYVDEQLSKLDLSSDYETKENVIQQDIIVLSNAQKYADSIKSDLLNGAGAAYDTLKELGELINENQDAIEVLETIAVNKANIDHTHSIDDIEGLENTGGITEQVQADWTETDTTSPSYIKNKPVISGDGGASVQANWDQTDATQADYIKNKPFYEYEGLVDIIPTK